MEKRIRKIIFVGGIFLCSLCIPIAGIAQNARTRSVRPAASPTPTRTDPEVISRADQYIDENGRVVTPVDPQSERPAPSVTDGPDSTVSDLDQRIRSLESARKPNSDEKARRLALNLDILTKAEQRVESLRKQYFEMVEKEGEIQQRLDTLELDLRPDAIERTVAFAGSLRPEVLREARQKSLSAERTKLQTLIAEVQKNKSNLDTNIQRADSLVERLRLKLEKEIDEALDEDEKPSIDQ